jgi:hypothetical protein
MKQRIIENISNAKELEKLYQENKSEFRKSFSEIADDFDSELVKFWKIRLTPEMITDRDKILKIDIWAVIIISLLSGLLIKLPELFSVINIESFYTRNAAIIVFNGLIFYTFWHNKIFEKKVILIYSLIMSVLLMFVNLLPYSKSDSVELAFIHTPLFLWCLFGLSFVSLDIKNTLKRIQFIRFNGELIIMTGLILLAGGLLTAITLGLFSTIKMNIEDFYMKYIAVFGGVAAPIVSFYIIKIYPNITSKIAPVIARVFTPLVFITLAAYLISLIFSDSKILEERELLILFNVVLLAVMAIIVFSVSELDKTKTKDFNVLVLFALAILAIIINSIALTAIITRFTYGITPNRTIVLFSNLLIFINLILISKNLYHAYFRNTKIDLVEETVAKYLTIYFGWTIVVIFILPFVFQFR